MTSIPSIFGQVERAPDVPVFKLRDDYLADSSPNKINLGVGAYRDGSGNPWVLPVVQTVEEQLVNDPGRNHEYLPITGLPAFCEAATKLCLGDGSTAIVNNRAGSVQTLSGTGAIRLAAEFLNNFYRVQDCASVVAFPDPTWGNHDAIFRCTGFDNRKKYRYWDAAKLCLDIEGMKQDLQSFPDYSIIVLHACAHNPTGIDPTPEQWMQIVEICKQKNHFPLFDCAYQGFASGDPDYDATSIRMFVEQGLEFMVCQSFAKNFGLYNERVGNLILVMRNPEALSNAKSQLALIIRQMYSNPPSHGAKIVATVLSNPAYKMEWRSNISTMSDRIKQVRKSLYEKLKMAGTPGNWEHIIKQIGMFSYTGLTEAQCMYLMNEKHIYLLKSGRISMCGLNDSNIDYFAESVKDAVTNVCGPKL